VIDGTATESQKASAKAQLDLLAAQDALTTNTTAASGAALGLATAGLEQLKLKDKLATAETAQITQAQAVADSMQSLARYVTSIPDFRAGERGILPGNSFTGAPDNGDSGRRGSSGTSGGDTTIVVKIGDEVLTSVVQKATQQMSMAGLATGRNSDVVWS
jgi:hypothetical protein